MRLVLGFDGGGTKTHCVLMDETRRICAESRSGPSNPMRVGFGGALAAICEAARSATQLEGVAYGKIGAICAGLAGTGHTDAQRKMERLLVGEFPGKTVRICTDLELTLEATGDGPSIVLIGGTGSAAVGRGLDGQIVRVGGQGPLLGDEGSSYDVGRRAAVYSLRAFDRCGKNTELGAKLLRVSEVADWAEFLQRAHAVPDEMFPKLFAVVADSAEAGDPTAQELVRQAVMDLAGLVGDLVGRLDLKDRGFQLLKSGGMFGKLRYFDAELDRKLRQVAPGAEFGCLAMTPAEAAARMAVRLLPQITNPLK